MPCRDFQSNHDKLVEDEGCEGDADNVEELVLKEPQTCENNRPALVHTDGEPCSECLARELAALGQVFVQLRVQKSHVFADVTIEHEGEHGRHRVDSGVADHEPALVQGDGRKEEDGGEHSLDDRYDQAAVDHKLGQFSASLVRVAAVP